MTKNQKRVLVLWVWACVSGVSMFLLKSPESLRSGLDLAYLILWACLVASTVISWMIIAVSGMVSITDKMLVLYGDVKDCGKKTYNPLIRFLVWINTDD